MTKIYRCPKCSEPVVWSHNKATVGSMSAARCSNRPENSTVDLMIDGILKEFCDWEGITIRKLDGTVEVVSKRSI